MKTNNIMSRKEMIANRREIAITKRRLDEIQNENVKWLEQRRKALKCENGTRECNVHNNRMYEAVWEVVACYKKIMNIENEALDGDAVDLLVADIKNIINRNEGNI